MGLDEVQADGLGQHGVILLDGIQDIPGQPAGIRALLNQTQACGSTQHMMELLRLAGQ